MSDKFGNTMKGIGKSAGKAALDTATQGSGKSLNDEYGVGDAAKDLANGAKNAAKGAKSASKMAAKAATGNYAGAVLEFLKNPGGVLTVIVAPILALAIVVTSVLGVLTNQIWNLIADNSVTSMVDTYIEELNTIESECFTPAYQSVSHAALDDVSSKVMDLSADKLGGEEFMKTRNSIFQSSDHIQQNLGTAYAQMRKFSSAGNQYTALEMIRAGTRSVFPIFEDASNGFGEVSVITGYEELGYSGITSDSDVIKKSLESTWNRTVRLIDFNIPLHTQSDLQNTKKIMYTFVYHNAKFNDEGISMSMFEMIHDQVYEYQHYTNTNDAVNNPNTKIIVGYLKGIRENILKLDENGKSTGTPNYADPMFLTRLNAIKLNCENLGLDIYYLNQDTIDEINSYIDIYNNKCNPETKLSHVNNSGYNSEEEKNAGYSETSGMFRKIADDKKKAFLEFMKREEVYSNLLTYKVKVSSKNPSSSQYRVPEYNVGTVDEPKTVGYVVKNIQKEVVIDINVDFCSTKTLAKIFGFYNEDGSENVGLMKWILENANASNREDEEVDDEYKLTWPLPIQQPNVSVSKSYSPEYQKIDVGAPYGTTVVSALPGTVVESGYSTDRGNYVAVESKVNVGESNEKTVQIVYSWLKQREVCVDSEVDRGSVLGYVGYYNSRSENATLCTIEMKEKSTGGTLQSVDPEMYLTTDSSKTYSYVKKTADRSTIANFFDECKDAGNATAAILTDAGYIKSSTFWQYKMNVFNVMFQSNVTDDTKLPFFVDINNIARNENGSLKIEEYSSATYGHMGLRGGSGASDAQNAETLNSKKYYAVYCVPNSIVTLRMSAQLANYGFGEYNTSKLAELWNGKNKDGSKGNYNILVTHLPKKPSDESLENGADHTEYTNWLNLENKIAMPVPGSDSYLKELPFTMVSYCFTTVNGGGFGFEVDNIQITSADGSNDEHLMTSNNYYLNEYGTYVRDSSWVSGASAYPTITEYLEAHKDESSFQIGSPVILGNVMGSDYYPSASSDSIKSTMKAYSAEDPNTYPFFVVSVTSLLAKEAGISDRSVNIFDVFDLDVIDDMTYNDEKSGMTWPLVKAYEYASTVTSNENGTVSYVGENFVIIKLTSGEYRRISNILPSDLSVGNTVVADDTNLGSAISGGAIHVYRDSLVDGVFKDVEELKSGALLKVSLNISPRTATALQEDSIGKYNTVVSMMSGKVTDITSNSITVFSEEQNLYYRYDNFVPDSTLLVDSSLANGQVIGRSYVYNGCVKVQVYGYLTDTNTSLGTRIHFNPLDFFADIGKNVEATRKVEIKKENAENAKQVAGDVVNKGDVLQLYAWIDVIGDVDREVVWASSNEAVATVDQNGRVTAVGSGSAIISCAFKNGEGLSATCTIVVPEHITTYQIDYKIGGDSNWQNYWYFDDFNSTNVRERWICVPMDASKETKITFKTTKQQVGAINSFTFTLTGKDGKKTSYATVSEKGVVTVKKGATPQKNDDYLVLTIRPTIASGANEDTQQIVSIPIHFYRPVESVKWANYENIQLYLGSDREQSRTIVKGDYVVYPSDASLDGGFELSYGDAATATFDIRGGAVYAKSVGNSYLRLSVGDIAGKRVSTGSTDKLVSVCSMIKDLRIYQKVQNLKKSSDGVYSLSTGQERVDEGQTIVLSYDTPTTISIEALDSNGNVYTDPFAVQVSADASAKKYVSVGSPTQTGSGYSYEISAAGGWWANPTEDHSGGKITVTVKNGATTISKQYHVLVLGRPAEYHEYGQNHSLTIRADSELKSYALSYSSEIKAMNEYFDKNYNEYTYTPVFEKGKSMGKATVYVEYRYNSGRKHCFAFEYSMIKSSELS